MDFKPHHLYHVYNQGNNRQAIFNNKEDYHTFLDLAVRDINKAASIVAYCLMPNHFHFLIGTDERVETTVQQGGIILDPLSNVFRRLLSGYARVFNKRYNQSGSLFRQKTKVKCLTDEQYNTRTHKDAGYGFNCFHYIHQNPVRAKLVNSLNEWEFSSYCEYAGISSRIICQKNMAIEFCEYDPDTFVKVSESVIPEFTGKDFQ